MANRTETMTAGSFAIAICGLTMANGTQTIAIGIETMAKRCEAMTAGCFAIDIVGSTIGHIKRAIGNSGHAKALSSIQKALARRFSLTFR
jgi:phage-related minor tail protein